MTRVWISGALIALIAAMGLFIGIRSDRSCRKLEMLAEHTAELCAAGDSEGAVRSAEELEQEWERFRSRASAVMLNSKLSEIDRICARIPSLAASSGGDALPELAELRMMLERLR